MTDETRTTVAEASPAATPEAAAPAPPAEPTIVEESLPAMTSAEALDSIDDEPAGEVITEATGVALHTQQDVAADAADDPASNGASAEAIDHAPATTQEDATVQPVAETAAADTPLADGAEPDTGSDEPKLETGGQATPSGSQAEAGATAVSTPDAPSGRNRRRGSDRRSSEADNEEAQRVVRMLSVGQQVKGTVKRISEFGAFVDIGVGRDGLVHISELSPRRIAKVTDVLQEGQEADFWIKKLDRDRNRISLTMIEPGMKTIRNMEKGDLVQGTVTRLMPYGAFVDIGIGRDALLHVREMGERYVAKPEDVVTVGELIEARIIDISRRRARVDLSIKGLRAEPEPEPQPEVEKPAAPPRPEPEPADNFADVDVLSPFAAALRRAEEVSGVKLNVRKEGKKERKPKRQRDLQEEIMERTLTGSRK